MQEHELDILRTVGWVHLGGSQRYFPYVRSQRSTASDRTNNVVLNSAQVLVDISNNQLAAVSWVIPIEHASDHPVTTDDSNHRGWLRWSTPSGTAPAGQTQQLSFPRMMGAGSTITRASKCPQGSSQKCTRSILFRNAAEAHVFFGESQEVFFGEPATVGVSAWTW
jgi:hypothetical protein